MYSSLLLAFLPSAFAAPTIKPKDATLIPGKYIVKFKDGCTHKALDVANPAIPPDFEYSFGGFNGFAGTLCDEELARLQASNMVDWIEQDTQVTAQVYRSESNATWGLGRISHRQKGDNTYIYDSSAGEGTCSYILDTGILTSHPEFEGRAEWLVNTVGDNIDSDLVGHGTHVAGIVGSKSYGVAKKTKLYAVKVLDRTSSGTASNVIAGISYVANDHVTRGCRKGAVANLSLSGDKTAALNVAIAAAVASGVFFTVAAGNNNQDVVNFSPGSEPTACTVGASRIDDVKAPFSNYGSLVDVFAPGVDILSTWNDGKTYVDSGTSMAAPHVAGLGAYLLSLENIVASSLCQRIVELSTKDALSNVPNGTANRLTFNGASNTTAYQPSYTGAPNATASRLPYKTVPTSYPTYPYRFVL